jgi:hypothetical protein
MTLKEAIDSGQSFKRPHWKAKKITILNLVDSHGEKYKEVFFTYHNGSETLSNDKRSFCLDDIINTDWELA